MYVEKNPKRYTLNTPSREVNGHHTCRVSIPFVSEHKRGAKVKTGESLSTLTMRDDCDDDGSSVNLLMMSSHDEETDEGTTCYSPATQTLNSLGLSQSRIDLRGGGLSQADLDLAAALVSVRNDKTMRLSPPKSKRTSAWIDDEYDSPDYPEPTLLSRAVPEDKDLPMTTQGTMVTSRTQGIDKKPYDGKRSARGRIPKRTPEIRQISDVTGNCVGSFSTYSAAAQASGVSRQMVTRILNGEIDQYKGWRFEYAYEGSDADEFKEEENQYPCKANQDTDQQGHSKAQKRCARSTICIEQVSLATGKVIRTFPTYTAAGKAVNCDRRVIAKIANGTMKGFNGFTFRQSTTTVQAVVVEPVPKAPARPKRPRDIKSRSIPIQQLDAATGHVVATYPSILVASASAKVNRHKVYAVLRGELDSWDGKIWRYENDPIEESTKPPPNKKVKATVSSESKTRSKSVTVVSTTRKHKPVDETHIPSGITPLLDSTSRLLDRTTPNEISTASWDSPQSRQAFGNSNGTCAEASSTTGQSRRQQLRGEGNDKPNTHGVQSSSRRSRGGSTATSANAMSKPSTDQGSSRGRRSGSSKKSRASSKAVSIQQFDAATGRLVATHASILVAAAKAGVNRHKVYAVLKGDKSDHKGTVWKYCTDEAEELTKPVDQTPKVVQANVAEATTLTQTSIPSSNGPDSQGSKTTAGSIPVQEYDVATGNLVATHTSISAAAKSSGINRRKIYTVLHGEASEFQGKTWKYCKTKVAERLEDCLQPSDRMAQTTEIAMDSPQDKHVIEEGNDSESQDSKTENTAKEMPAERIGLPEKPSSVEGVSRKLDDSQLDEPTEEHTDDVTLDSQGSKAQKTIEEKTETKVNIPAEQDSVEPSNDDIDSPVQQFDAHGRLVATFSSASIACAKSGARACDVSAVLNGEIDNWNGVRWSYYTTSDVVESEITLHDDSKLIFVEEIDSGTGRLTSQYTSIPALVNKHRIEERTVYEVLNGELCDWNGLVWRYAVEGDDETAVTLPQSADASTGSPQKHYASNGADPTNPDNPIRTKETSAIPTAHFQSPISIPRPSSSDAPPPRKQLVRPAKGDTEPFFVEGNEYIVLQVTVTENGPIGVNVTDGKAPTELVDMLHQDGRLHTVGPFESSMCVTSFISSSAASPASTAGIQVNDWLFLLSEDRETVHMAYDAVRSGVVSGARPVVFLVGRKKDIEFPLAEKSSVTVKTGERRQQAAVLGGNGSVNTPNGGSPSELQPEQHTSPTNTSISVSRDPCDGMDPGSLSLCHASKKEHCAVSNQETTLSMSYVPFCVRCKKQKKAGMHHPWCPENPQFEKSGANSILRRMQLGIKVGCEMCQSEYKTGKRARGCHSIECQQRSRPKSSKARLLTDDLEGKENISDEETGSSADDVDDGSIFEASNKHSRLHRLRFVDPKKSNKLKRNHGDTIAGVKRTRQEPPTKKHVSKLVATSETVGSENLIVEWKTCPNPWGKIELSVHDEVVFSSSQTVELHSPSHRYAVNPFASDNYKKTHQSPKNGCQVVVLQRDPNGLAPWGFEIKKHEFGGACVVSTVDRLSPASTGVSVWFQHPSYVILTPIELKSWVGIDGTNTAPLSVHDIILSVNGKLVGGMNVHSLDAVLKSCTSKLVLVVARYLHARDLKNRRGVLEANQFQKIDLLINDKQGLEWVDYGRVTSQQGLSVLSIQGIANESPCRLNTKRFSEPKVDRDKHTEENDGTAIDGEQFRIAQGVSGRTEPMDIQEATTRRFVDNLSVTDHDRSALSTADSSGGILGHHKWASGESSTPQPKFSIKKPSSAEMYRTSPIHKFFEEYKDTHSVLGDQDSAPGSPGNDADDGNAWLGCPCGVVHRCLPVFWIQCDSCNSWYNPSPSCVGFDESDAIKLPSWVCPGCRGSCSPGNTFGDPDCIRSPMAPRRSEVKSLSVGEVATTALPEEPVSVEFPTVGEEVVSNAPKEPRFKKGDFVLVEEHAWEGVNNEGGFARILKAYEDEEEDIVYDIKYIVGGYKKKAVMEEYLEPHSFD